MSCFLQRDHQEGPEVATGQSDKEHDEADLASVFKVCK